MMEEEIDCLEPVADIGLGTLNHLLECSICLNFIVEPVTICCGHSFCKMCLVKSLRRHKKKW